jgi:hypothetical protein
VEAGDGGREGEREREREREVKETGGRGSAEIPIIEDRSGLCCRIVQTTVPQVISYFLEPRAFLQSITVKQRIYKKRDHATTVSFFNTSERFRRGRGGERGKGGREILFLGN